jgi:N,N-dimethylformamidase
LIGWLEARGFGYHVITDENLHREGAAVLRPYNVMLTGSHPKYYSAAVLDGMEDYLTAGGRLMYLGGNDFYWGHRTIPRSLMLSRRVRQKAVRAHGKRVPANIFIAPRASVAGFGAIGLGRRRSWLGSVFAAQGFDHSTYYRRMPDSNDRRARLSSTASRMMK